MTVDSDDEEKEMILDNLRVQWSRSEKQLQVEETRLKMEKRREERV